MEKFLIESNQELRKVGKILLNYELNPDCSVLQEKRGCGKVGPPIFRENVETAVFVLQMRKSPGAGCITAELLRQWEKKS